MSCPHLPEGFDFTDPDLLQARVPLPEFAEMRKTAPVWWCTQPAGISGFADEGYWAVTRHADVKHVSTHPELFSSNTNTAVIRFNETISRDQIEVQKLIMLNMDPPEHTRVRQIVQRGFTPRAVRSLEGALRRRAHAIVEEAAAAGAKNDGTFDFVTDIAVELPSRPSPNSSAYPRRTAPRSSTGPTRWRHTTTPSTPSPRRSAPRRRWRSSRTP